MFKLNFLFGVFLGTLLSKHSDNLSKTLQHVSCRRPSDCQIKPYSSYISSYH